MVSDEQRDTLASKLLERKLVSTRDEALALAEKFLEMDVREKDDSASPAEVADEIHVAVAGSNLESAENAGSAYEQVLYYERIALEPSGKSVFPNARVDVEDVPARSEAAPGNTEALERLHRTEIDLTQMFNVDNMKRHVQES